MFCVLVRHYKALISQKHHLSLRRSSMPPVIPILTSSKTINEDPHQPGHSGASYELCSTCMIFRFEKKTKGGAKFWLQNLYYTSQQKSLSKRPKRVIINPPPKKKKKNDRFLSPSADHLPSRRCCRWDLRLSLHLQDDLHGGHTSLLPSALLFSRDGSLLENGQTNMVWST